VRDSNREALVDEDIRAHYERIIGRLNARADYLEGKLAELEKHVTAKEAAIELRQSAKTQQAGDPPHIKLLH
jgi:hypothetical protein